MPGRVHQNDAPALSLASSIAAGDSVIPVNQSISGVETPISYVINSGGANEEIVTLTSKNTSTSPSQFEDVVRGCDGTADQAHSSGEVLTHEATARDFVDRSAVHASMFAPSQLDVFADFREDAANADGYVTASGHTMTVEQGGWSITNGVLKNDGSGAPDIITIPFSPSSNFWTVVSDFVAANDKGYSGGVIIQWLDSSNYQYFTWKDGSVGSNAKNGMSINRVSSGSLSEKAVFNASGGIRNSPVRVTSRFIIDAGARYTNDRVHMTSPYIFEGTRIGNENGSTSKIGFVAHEPNALYHNITAFQS